MNTVSNVIVKVAVLVGGAVLGALVARRFDEILTLQAQERSDYLKNRYAQGLGPISTYQIIEEDKYREKED